MIIHDKWADILEPDLRKKKSLVVRTLSYVIWNAWTQKLPSIIPDTSTREYPVDMFIKLRFQQNG